MRRDAVAGRERVSEGQVCAASLLHVPEEEQQEM